MAKRNPQVPLHLFDSFEGLSKPESIDEANNNSPYSWKEGNMASSEQGCLRVELNSDLWDRKGDREIGYCYPVGEGR
jgi:hypothetical protein